MHLLYCIIILYIWNRELFINYFENNFYFGQKPKKSVGPTVIYFLQKRGFPIF